MLDKLDPRRIIRLATVLKMKDRAGTIGARGVGPLLVDLLGAAPEGRLHLIGHSYGAKVVLSALTTSALPRPANSLLLLQPAVSHLCFAADANGGRPGGYRGALARVEQPILTTFSRHDQPLTKFFHLAVRRSSDLGELRIAAPVPPSRFAALGGFGPGRCGTECREAPIKAVGDPYDLYPSEAEVLALNGDAAITGHGDISNPATWWALYCQAAGPARA